MWACSGVCRLILCMCRCKAAWHAGMTCEENKSHLEDVDTLKLASAQSWRKCPHCGSSLFPFFPLLLPIILFFTNAGLLGKKWCNPATIGLQACLASTLCSWRKLYGCRHMVEKVAGCNTMACRCGVGSWGIVLCTSIICV